MDFSNTSRLIFPSVNETDLSVLAVDFAAYLRDHYKCDGVVIALEGPLGAGKTTFVRYLTTVLGSNDHVSSPSYTLEHDYQGADFLINHWDIYRLGCADLPEELYEPPSPGTIRLVEWYKNSQDLTSPDYTVQFEISEEDQLLRTITLMKHYI